MSFFDRFKKKDKNPAEESIDNAAEPIKEPATEEKPFIPLTVEEVREKFAPPQTLFCTGLTICQDPVYNGTVCSGTVENTTMFPDIFVVRLTMNSKFKIDRKFISAPKNSVDFTLTCADVGQDIWDELSSSDSVPVDVIVYDPALHVLAHLRDDMKPLKPAESSASSDTEKPEVPAVLPGQQLVPGTEKSYTTTKSKINADIMMCPVVDIKETDNGKVLIGKAFVSNFEESVQNISLRVICNEKETFESPIELEPGKISTVAIKVLPDMIRSDLTRFIPANIIIGDSVGDIVAARTESVKVRSEYDFDLNKVELRTAQFVNPHTEAVVEFMESSTGELFKADKDLSVTGYTDGDNIERQLRAVFTGFRQMGFHYVSDTNTVRDRDSYFQRVRNPQKVMEDRTGNCMELSILFASVFEAMGFEPVVALLDAHAIPGIVLSTDMHSTKSNGDYDNPKAFEFTQDGKKTKVLFVESTLIPCKSANLEDAIDSAYDSIKAEFDSINSKHSYVLIKKFRNEGVMPEEY